jgi:hypothetical protein
MLGTHRDACVPLSRHSGGHDRYVAALIDERNAQRVK